jgi:deazaflavin-dependent oxidoreductase (nitroreductase family)
MLAQPPYDGGMPLPHWLTRVNLVVGNRITAPFATFLPWFCVVEHVGRRSGTVRRTPVSVFHRGDRYTFVLFYGPDVQWVANVLAAGECRIRTRGHWVRLAAPRRFADPERRSVPGVVRIILRVLRVTEFLEMRAAGGGSGRRRPIYRGG